MNYFLYARKSTGVEDKRVQFIGDQLAIFRALAGEEELFITLIEKQSAKQLSHSVFEGIRKRTEKGERYLS